MSEPSLGFSGGTGGSPSHERLLAIFGLAVALSIGLGMVSWGRAVIYPFNLFATWAHEMGHGVGALITGNSFVELELYRSLGGQALTSGADGFSQVVVSSLGLVGPAIVGAVVMIAGSRPAVAPFVLAALSGVVAISTLVWVRNGFGFVAMLTIAAALGVVARFGSTSVRIGLAQLLAVQMALASWSSRDYLFTSGFQRNGFRKSDTQNIADELFLPYWFWGAMLGGVSILVLGWAFWFAWIRPHARQETAL